MRPQMPARVVHAICTLFLPPSCCREFRVLIDVDHKRVDCSRRCQDAMLAGEGLMLIIRHVPGNSGIQVTLLAAGVTTDTITVVRAR
ncbi:hypothetical protein EDD16DRAFT_197977 [Pisolithus croceorrhizus]|nr:hypothetical protein EDD16DRAFT_197977 [Pisolithus croceorrhizus]